MKNVILTFHCTDKTNDFFKLAIQQYKEVLINYYNTKTFINIANKNLGY